MSNGYMWIAKFDEGIGCAYYDKLGTKFRPIQWYLQVTINKCVS